MARGQVLEALARGDEALAAYDRALAVKGVGRVRAQYAKAALLMARKDYDAARPLLVEVAPENGQGSLPEAYESLGELLFARGEFAKGCEQYFIALSRARLQGAALDTLQFKASDVERRLVAAGQPAMSKTWKSETDALLH
jgi:tetratricopeptide (TPR) repeat protein